MVSSSEAAKSNARPEAAAMTMSREASEKKIDETKRTLSAMWIFASLNFVCCDVLSIMDPAFIKILVSGGQMPGFQVNQRFLLMAALMLEPPFAMVMLSRVLKRGAARWANILVGCFMAVVQVGSVFFGTAPTLHYLFFSAVEIAAVLFIAIYAMKGLRGKEAS